MAIKITKQGRKIINLIGRCPTCGCEFTCDLLDMRMRRKYEALEIQTYLGWTDCPNCKADDAQVRFAPK
jgi:hypothetical protein